VFLVREWVQEKENTTTMRELLIEPTILATFEAGQLRVQGLPVSIREVTDEGGILLQARVNLGTPEKPIMARRTYTLSGAQFCVLVSDKTVPDPEPAGLLMAKNMMVRQNRAETERQR
jgi:hypothetical protein